MGCDTHCIVVNHSSVSAVFTIQLELDWRKHTFVQSLFILKGFHPSPPLSCCLPTPPCLFGGVLPYVEVTGHPVSVSSLGFKCPDCFIWNCSYIVYPSKMKGPFRDNCPRYYYL